MPTVIGVKYSAGPGAQVYTVMAHKEVILSAGVFGTPQLLMLSGIGDPKALAKAGVKSVVDLPAVGANLQE